MLKKKILIFISSDLFIRNYIYTKSFKEIEKKYNCFYLLSSNVTLKKEINEKKILGTINYKINEIKKFNYFNLKNFILNEQKSKSIKFAIKIILNLKIFYKEQSIFINVTFFFLRIIANLKKRIYVYYIKFLSKLKDFNLINPGYEINKNLKTIIKNLNPNLIIVPTQGQQIDYYDILRLSKKENITTLALIDNWDNMSIRPHQKIKANFYGVWGEQSKLHGKKIQNISLKKIFLLGTPRYSNYFIERKKIIKSLYPFKYILFLETFGITENLDKIFFSLENLIKKNIKFKDYKIIYRPHPWRKDKNTIDLSKFQNIILDTQIKNQYLNKNFQTSFQPKLDYYPSLIKNSEFVISGPGSMIIESLIFYKKILLLMHDKNEKFGHYAYYSNYEHCKNVEKIDNIVTCENLSCINEDINLLLSRNIKKKKIDKHRNFYLFNNNLSYSDRILKIIKTII